MKKLLSLAILMTLSLGLFTACEEEKDSDTTLGLASECNISNNVEDKYEDDAVRLALRLQQAGPLASQIEIPQALIDRALGALSAVYNSDFAARDSIVDEYDIHTVDYPAYNEFTLQVDTTFAWVKEWEDGNRLTEYAPIDELMNAYSIDIDGGLTPVTVNIGGTETTVFIASMTSTRALNLGGLVSLFEGIDGVVSGNFNETGADGNNINIIDNGNAVELTYSIGYDDDEEAGECLADCEFMRSWFFTVYDSDCSAVYTGVEGDPAP
ncbi:MAG: hypothetical protein ACPG5B_08170 [Chitinophagales bacterium]